MLVLGLANFYLGECVLTLHEHFFTIFRLETKRKDNVEKIEN